MKLHLNKKGLGGVKVQEKRDKSRKRFKECVQCEERRVVNDFYTSYSQYHADGRIPYCKACVREMVDEEDESSVQTFLRLIDRPFLYELWEKSKNGKQGALGAYMKNLAMQQYRELTYEDSVFETLPTGLDVKLKPLERATLENKWGLGFSDFELASFEKKYKFMMVNYTTLTSLHEEALRRYCTYQVKTELAIASNKLKEAKEWAALAKDAAAAAKINPSQLKRADLTHGMDSFGEVVRLVETNVDLIGIMPKFIAKPRDKVDFAIWCYVNYARRLRDLPEIEYADVYDFYQSTLKEYKDHPDYSDVISEITLDNKSKKKILMVDVNKTIEDLKRENSDDSFIQNIDKWIEMVSFYRWYPDLFFDTITPSEGGIRLDLDQRIMLRTMVRFKQNYGIMPRGYSKTFLEILEKYHTCIFYPNVRVSISAQTRENAASLIKEKHEEILRFYPLIVNELSDRPKFQKDIADVYFKSNSRLDVLANQQSAKGARRHRLTLEESALMNDGLFQDQGISQKVRFLWKHWNVLPVNP